MNKHIAIVQYYLPIGRVVSEHEAGSDALWRLLNDLHTRAIRYTCTFRTIHEGERNHAQNA